MDRLIIRLDAPAALDPDRVGPKAANLARLARAGLPTPGSVCLEADAYRIQMAELGLDALARMACTAGLAQARRLAVEARLGLYEKPIPPRILEPMLAAWPAHVAAGRRPRAGPASAPLGRHAG